MTPYNIPYLSYFITNPGDVTGVSFKTCKTWKLYQPLLCLEKSSKIAKRLGFFEKKKKIAHCLNMSDSGDQVTSVINIRPQEVRDDVVIKIALIGDAQVSKCLYLSIWLEIINRYQLISDLLFMFIKILN